MADILPQLIDFATQLDLQRLIVIQTTLCLFAALRSVPVYNLPLLFFGLYAYQHHDSIEPLQQFAGFTAFSILLDIVWFLLTPSFGFGEGLTIAVLLFKPMSIISALQLLKYRGDPFSPLGAGMSWTGLRSQGYDGTGDRYHALADDMDDLRDAEEISIPRHHSQQQGRNRTSQHSSSFATTNSSRSTSVKSSRTGSGHHVDLGIHSGSNVSASAIAPSSPRGNGHGSPGSVGVASFKDDHKDKVGHAFSEDEDESPDTAAPAAATATGHEGPVSNTDHARAGYQPF
ncbi:hypothetical protein BGZ70_009546 [Mortierella alpina]|uniref:Uncharacterized protein n=1 Tax=Mortierella alpina TaxID=64518 RepID=A0A9P6M0K3_MORAP|nr:hypothetical protein BGZ70_009546 [Mortierella alpina]